jgi:NADP-dependent 3-hydroxy acid dehydrogenase YdfG
VSTSAMNVSGKYVWLVGASEGIGAALATSLVRAGAHVTVSARSVDKLTQLVATLAGSNHHAVSVDVSDVHAVNAAWQMLITLWSQVDMVIYNAGAYTPMDATQFDLTVAEKMVDINFHGALRVLSCVLPYFISRNAGHIALVGSVAGYRGLPSAIGYGASKAALIHLAENVKADLADTNIRVQIINPGFVATRLTAKNDFAMPCIITPERAAQYIMAGLVSHRFEIHFPKRFSCMLKFLALLPYGMYFWALKRMRLKR